MITNQKYRDSSTFLGVGIVFMTILVIITLLSNLGTPPKPAITQETLDHLTLEAIDYGQISDDGCFVRDSTTIVAKFTDRTGKTISVTKTHHPQNVIE